MLRRFSSQSLAPNMNPVTNLSTDIRLQALQQWLNGLGSQHELDISTLEPASSDASFRRYFRLQAGHGTVIVMDAPPPHEDCGPFVHVTRLLAEAGLNVPTVLAQNQSDGFLLLSDLGRVTFYQAVQAGLDDASLQTLYRGALGALVRMQQASTQGLHAFDATRLMEELSVFPEWYAQTHCNAALTDAE